jgi:hypothetical protein
MSMQNSWASNYENGMKKNTLLLYKWCVFSTYDVLMWSTYDLHFN